MSYQLKNKKYFKCQNNNKTRLFLTDTTADFKNINKATYQLPLQSDHFSLSEFKSSQFRCSLHVVSLWIYLDLTKSKKWTGAFVCCWDRFTGTGSSCWTCRVCFALEGLWFVPEFLNSACCLIVQVAHPSLHHSGRSLGSLDYFEMKINELRHYWSSRH